jgi:hypothetical protein
MTFWKKIRTRLTDETQAPQPSAERESPRFATRMIVSFENESATNDTLGNVGIGGFCFQAEHPVQPGQHVDLLLDLDGMGHWVLARGEVLGCVELKRAVGVRGRFTNIAFEDERHLARWLDRQALAA